MEPLRTGIVGHINKIDALARRVENWCFRLDAPTKSHALTGMALREEIKSWIGVKSAEDDKRLRKMINQVEHGLAELEKSEFMSNPATKFDLFGSITKSVDGDKPSILVTASSSEPDLANDIMSARALGEMRAAFPGMTIFHDHNYSVANGDVFGVVKTATLVTRGEHTDLDLVIDVAMSNSKAAQTYDLIKSGVRLGVSIGVLVRESHMVKDGTGAKFMQIDSVQTLEASIVGIPASRRSWVRDALKAASYSMYGVPFAGDDDTRPEDASEVSALKTALSAYVSATKALQRQLEERDETMSEILSYANRLLNTPVGRKCDPAVAAGLASLGDKYGEWLAPEIVAMLSKNGVH